MTRICAWCAASLDLQPVLVGPITHGICQPCQDILMADCEIPRSQNKASQLVDRKGLTVWGARMRSLAGWVLQVWSEKTRESAGRLLARRVL